MSDPVEISHHGDVALVRLRRPEVHNAMNLELLGALAESLHRLAADEESRAVVLTGGTGAFSAGGDLLLIANHRGGPAAGIRELAGRLHRAVAEIRRMPKPVIAAISGPAAGAGMSLALACDLRIMARSARFVLAYTSRGLSIDGGASFSLPRTVGLARALEIAALDEPISAKQALAWGLVTRLVNDSRVVDEALALAHRLAERSVHAFGATKRLFVDSFGRTLEAQLDLEQRVLERCAVHADGAEGLAAFGEKRAPAFRRGANPTRPRARRATRRKRSAS